MPYADLGDIRMYYDESGSGEPVVLLHGFSLDRRMWEDQADFLSRDYRVICPDARGHGLSDVTPTGYSRAHRVEDLARLVDTLKIGRFHLVGLSMGGATAIGYALKYQARLHSLTLVSTGAAGYSVSKKFERLDRVARETSVDEARAKWMEWSLAWYKGDRAAIGERLKTMMDEYTGSVWRDPMRGKYPREVDQDAVDAITVPTALFAGELDKVFCRLAELLHERIAGSRLLVYDGIGHMLNLEAPDRFNADLDAFLRGTGKL
ncbi:MAG: alpha/beta fold hydrolase [candidate division Zixibacteria bacterium]|nr:alpha/beta fold hydrolase [candidate division Zixibacteria bacterium]